MWDFFVNMWVKVLRGWEKQEACTLPRVETHLPIEALSTMQQSTVFQQPRVAVSSSRSPPKLRLHAHNQQKKVEQAEVLRAEHARVTEVYRLQGWNIVYPDGSSELHQLVGRVGGFGAFLGDDRDTAATGGRTNQHQGQNACIPKSAGRPLAWRAFACPDCLVIVKGVLEWT